MAEAPAQVLLIAEDRSDMRRLSSRLAEALLEPVRFVARGDFDPLLPRLARGEAAVVLLAFSDEPQDMETLRRIRAVAPRLPVLVLLAPGEAAQAEHALQAGAQRALDVSASADQLAAAAREAALHATLDEALRDGLDRACQAIRRMPIPVAVLDRQMRYLMVSDSYLEQFGLRLEQILGRPLQQMLPDVPAPCMDSCRRCLRGQQVRAEHQPYVRPDGRQEFLTWEARPWYDLRGRVGGVILYEHFTTEQYRAEQALAEQQEQFRILAESAQAIIGIVQGRHFVYANRYMERISGYSREELLRLDVLQCVHPDDRAMVGERLVRRLAGEDVPTHYEFRMLTRAGQARLMDFSVARTYYRGAPAVIGIAYDVTERRQAEQALRESEENYRRLVEAAGAIVVRIDLEGRITFFNEFAERFYGYDKAEALGRPIIGIFVSPEDAAGRDSAQVARDVAIEHPEQYAYREGQSLLKDGRRAWVAWFNRPLIGPGGQVQGVLSIGLDITARKQAELDLKALNETLEQRVAQRSATAQRRAEQLRALTLELTQTEQRERRRLARVLHDHLQQLLVAARLQLDNLRGRTAPEAQPALAQAMELLRESIEAARSLTVELSPPVLYEASLAVALRWLARQMRQMHNLEVVVQAQERADPVEDVRILLFQAVRELLFNVVKHAGVGEARVSLARRGAHHVEVVVEDRGVGFDTARLAPGEATAGGLGLFGIRERVELIGGRMDVSSAPGQGTRVMLKAPLRLAGPTHRRPARPPRRARRAGKGRIRVLLADDHSMVRQALAGILSLENDMQVVGEAADGLQALELARKLHPDVIVMDVSMPNMNGIDATRRITAEMPDIRVIALSMHAQSDLTEQMRHAGAVDYVAKGGPSEALVAAIRASRK